MHTYKSFWIFKDLAISVIDKDEVLLAIMASLGMCFSSSRIVDFLMSISSIIASTTRSLSLKPV